LVENQNGLTATDTDLAALARIYAQKAGADPEPMTKILGSYTVESSVFTDGTGDTTKFGRTVVRDLFMRPTEESWTALASLVLAMSELDKPSDKDTLRVLSAALDAANAVQVGLVEANGIEATGKAKDQTFGLATRRSAYQSATQTHPAELRTEGIELRMPEGTAKVDAISYTGFSFQPTLEGLRALRGKLTDKMDDLDSATIRSLIPTIGTIRYTGLSFDGRIPRENRTDRERLQISLGEAEFTAEKSRNGIPTHVRIAVRNLAFPLPADGKEESLKPMLDLGYKALNISGSLSATWNEAKQEILLTDVSLGGTEMGQIAMKGVIGGVKPDVFNLDTAVATAAALSATARSVEIAVENGGLFDRYLQQEAGKQKKAPEALRREYGAAAALAVPVMLGNSDQAKALGQAVARFIAKPNRLRITARTKNPAGLGLTDLMVLSDPAAALEKLEISVTTD